MRSWKKHTLIAQRFSDEIVIPVGRAQSRRWRRIPSPGGVSVEAALSLDGGELMSLSLSFVDEEKGWVFLSKRKKSY